VSDISFSITVALRNPELRQKSAYDTSGCQA
jgi:hypothetical protein